ncbi:MAG: hypothetical protein ACKVOK_05725, partial [Flavobacteriales bacterium]
MKNFTLVSVVMLCLSVSVAWSQSHHMRWTNAYSGSQNVMVTALVTDPEDNVYAVGTFDSETDFDPGEGVNLIAPQGTSDVFVTCSDPDGNTLWVKTVGGTGSVEAYDIAQADDGSLFITGKINGDIDFDLDSPLGLETGSNNTFVFALDNTGDFIGTLVYGSETDGGQIAISNDFFYVSSNGSGTGDFDPTGNTDNFTSNGGTDIYVTKFTTDADYVWTRRVGGAGDETCGGLEIDGNNRIILAGNAGGSSDFNPDVATTTLINGGFFVTKWNDSGNLIWVKEMSPLNAGTLSGLAIDPQNRVYLTGSYSGTVDFNGGVAQANETSAGGLDVFVCRYSTTGVFDWVKSMPNAGDAQATAIALNLNTIYVTGYFDGSLDTDPSAGEQTLTSNGGNDIFVTRLTLAGLFDSSFALGGTGEDITNGALAYNNDTFVIGGSFSNTVDFDPDADDYSLTATGVMDGFIAKLEICPNPQVELIEFSCGPYEAPDGQIYNESGTYIAVVSNGSNCDVVFNIQLTIGNSPETVFNVNSCGPYDWNGNTYSESGTYSEMYTNTLGCDSVVTLNLTIGESFINPIEAFACDVYDYNGLPLNESGIYEFDYTTITGCDSTVVLYLTIANSSSSTIEETACGSITINDETFTESGEYTQILTNAASCDSIISLNLTINPAYDIVIDQAACEQFEWNGNTYTESGTYIESYTTEFGCDSVITLNLTIGFPADEVIEVAACDSYEANGDIFTESGTFEQTLQTAAGCDSVLTIILTITNSVSTDLTATACGSYTWNAETYTESGVYEQIFDAANGCDSIVTLDLTINPVYNDVLDIAACEQFEWDGTTYTTSGTYVNNYTTLAGCDSTVTLNLTIGFPASETLDVSVCDSYEINGETFTTSGTYEQIILTSAGCDSTLTLNLTISYSSETELFETACGSYTWNAVTYTESGTYGQSFESANGCDSLVTLNLTVNPVYDDVLNIAACGQYDWDGTTYTASGTYVNNYTTAAGCDSTVTLNLTIG